MQSEAAEPVEAVSRGDSGVFSRGHATLHLAVSVGRSFGRSVRPSVRPSHF